jgi:hypothetical protein
MNLPKECREEPAVRHVTGFKHWLHFMTRRLRFVLSWHDKRMISMGEAASKPAPIAPASPACAPEARPLDTPEMLLDWKPSPESDLCRATVQLPPLLVSKAATAAVGVHKP